MAKKSTAPAPPKEALPDGEPNRFVAKFKAPLCKRWSMTRMATLFEIFDLAAFLWALERNDEALAVAVSVADAIPAPPPLPTGGVNHNLWCPATHAHALIVHLAPIAGKARAKASREAILGDCGVSRHNPSYIEEGVAEAGRLASGASEKTQKWECLELAGSLGTMLLYAELANAGDAYFVKHAKDAGKHLSPLLAKLRARLESK